MGELVGKLTMLEIAGSRCDPARASAARPVDRGARGRDRALVLGEILAGDCPKARTVSINDRCGINFPQLPDLFSGTTVAR